MTAEAERLGYTVSESPLYKLYRAKPPTTRLTSIGSAYHNGRDGHPCRYEPTSFAWIAWHAGRDARKRGA